MVRHLPVRGTVYIPKPFLVEDRKVIVAFMQQFDFAAVVSHSDTGFVASHVPVLIREVGSELQIVGHVARGNSHWRLMDRQTESMVIFQGPHAYVSPTWYAVSPAVPTWNYAVVHAYGRPAVVQDKDWLRRHVTELTTQQEASEAQPWAVSDAPENYVDVMLRGIVGFRFAITRLEGKWKMSQNREMPDRQGVVAGLTARASGDDLAIAEAVARATGPDR